MAPLAQQLVPVSLSQGVDTKTDPKQVAVGKLLALENAVFTNPGMLRKRFGQLTLTSPGSTGYGVTTFKDELVSWSGNGLYSLASANDSQVSKGTLQSPITTVPWQVRNAYQQSYIDGAVSSDGLIRVYAYMDTRSAGCYYSVIDAETGQVIAETAITNGDKPRVVQLGSFVAVIYRNTGDNKLYVIGIPSANPTAPLTAASIVTTVNNAVPAWVVNSDGSQCFVAWNHSTATTLGIGILSSGLSFTGPVTTAATINLAMDIGIEGQNYMSVVWYDGSNVKQIVLAYADLSATSATFTVENVANVATLAATSRQTLSGGANSWAVAYTVTGASTDLNKVRYRNTSAGSTSGSAADLMLGCQLAARPFIPSGSDVIVYPTETQMDPQSTYFLVRSDGKTIARYCSGTAGQASTYYLPQTTTDGTVWHQPLQTRELFTTLVDNTATASPSVNTGASTLVYSPTGVQAALFNFFDATESFSTAEVGQNLVINGGLGLMYDGLGVVEQGFNFFPSTPTMVDSGSGTSKTNGAVYWYAAVYEWLDSQGTRHQSAPSFAGSYTAPGAHDVTVTLTTLRNTLKTGVNIVVYRTIANGATFYRISNPTTAPNNSLTANTVTFLDNVTDAAAQYGETLYTLGGVLENDPLPSARALTTWGGRLAYLPGEGDSLTFGISKRVFPGVPVQCSTSLLYPVDPRGGALTSLGALDDKLVLFKRSSIFIAVGHGPDDTGQGDDLAQNPAQLLTTDVGCTNQRSIVTTPLGLMFQSPKGIYLLNRSLQVSYIGAPVEAYNANTVVSAVLIAKQNQVRFGLDSGVALVYDYFVGQWTVFTNYSQVDATNWLEQYVIIRSDGVLRQEDPSSFTDNGNIVPMRIQTSWLSLSGLQGYQRVWKLLILGEWKSSHSLLVGLAYDYNSSQTQVTTITPSNPGTWGSGATWGSDSTWGGSAAAYQFQVHLTKQKCQAIQVTLTDASSYGESLSLSALSFLVGVERGAFRVPPARQYG